MAELLLKDKTFVPLLSHTQIQERVKEIAARITGDLEGTEPLFLIVLSGAFMFAGDLLRNIRFPLHIGFVKLASYRGMESTGSITETLGISEDVEGRQVVIVEDIVDSGQTIDFLIPRLQKMGAATIRVSTLLYKPQNYKGHHEIDYYCFEIPPAFVVGYGLDYDGLGRNIDAIWQLKTNKNMKNIVLFGPPGAGKGTQAKILMEKFNLIHLSTGDIFRRNIGKKTELGRLASSYIDKGDLVPDEVTIKMLQSEVETHPNAAGFIFDGFPRTVAQAEALDSFLLKKNQDISMMLALEVPEEELKKRLMGRAKESGRPDDANPEVVQNRIRVYQEQTAPVATFYKNQNKLQAIKGVGSIDDISERLAAVIESI